MYIAVLSNLAQDSRLRGKIINSLGYENDQFINGNGSQHGSNNNDDDDSSASRSSQSNSWVATRSQNSIPAVYLILTDLLRKDIGINDNGGSTNMSNAATNTDVTGHGGGGASSGTSNVTGKSIKRTQ